MPTVAQEHYPDEDARHMMHYHAIKADPKRHVAASKAAGQMAQEKMEEAKAMKKVAQSVPVKHTPTGGLTKKKF